MSTAAMNRQKKEMPTNLPMQRRFSKVRAEQADANGLVPISFSSDTPIKRGFCGYWWYEVLNHGKNAVITDRLDQGIAMLVNHDPNQRAGILLNGKISNGVGRGNVKFNTTDFGKSVRQEVDDETLPWVSVGYIIHEMNRAEDIDPADDENPDYMGTYTVDSWEPVETSFCAVPADPSVGAGRSADQIPQYPVAIKRAIETATAALQEERNMSTTPTLPAADIAAATAQVRTAELQRIADLDAVHGQYPNLFTAEQRSAFVRENRTADDARAHVLAEMAKRSGGSAASPSVEVIQDEEDKRPKNLTFSRCVRAMAGARGNRNEAVRFATDVLQDRVAARALAAGAGTSGGFTLPETMTADIIEFLRPQTVVRSLNPILAPLVNGVLTMPKLTAGVSGSYIGENQNITASQQSFGQVKMSAKKLACVVPISNDLIRYASGMAADNIVRDDMAAGVAQTEDGAFIRGAGTQFSPKGLRFWAPAANQIAANAVLSLTNTRQDIGKVRLALRKGNVRFLRPGWIMSPRTEEYLLNLADGNGNLVYYNEMVNKGTFRSYPYKVTTLIPENLGAGSDTELYLADFADVVIAEVPNIVIEVSTEATYWDGTQLQSAFSQDQTVIKMIIEHDLAVRHPESVAVLTAVEWQ
jgi:HK97 family phage major capsid protein